MTHRKTLPQPTKESSLKTDSKRFWCFFLLEVPRPSNAFVRLLPPAYLSDQGDSTWPNFLYVGGHHAQPFKRGSLWVTIPRNGHYPQNAWWRGLYAWFGSMTSNNLWLPELQRATRGLVNTFGPELLASCTFKKQPYNNSWLSTLLLNSSLAGHRFAQTKCHPQPFSVSACSYGNLLKKRDNI